MSVRRALARNAARVRRVSARRGALPVLRDCAGWLAGFTLGRLRRPGPFQFRGRAYTGFHHRYHYTWLNEREVEVPIFSALLRDHPPERVLEVGNVMAHYASHEHLVVDRYECAPGVVNEDVVAFDPGRDFDLIVAISTLEHVGLDEEPRDPCKPLRAIARLRGLLAPGGQLVVSVPVGYNPDLDAALRDGAAGMDTCHALLRSGGRWVEADPADVCGTPYDELLFRARALIIATAGPATSTSP